MDLKESFRKVCFVVLLFFMTVFVVPGVGGAGSSQADATLQSRVYEWSEVKSKAGTVIDNLTHRCRRFFRD
ncbi:hypothetical protein BVY02_00120 [bacterium J17]|nr:hypothetical protein BVY02_00120 [bacterium J17]